MWRKVKDWLRQLVGLPASAEPAPTLAPSPQDAVQQFLSTLGEHAPERSAVMDELAAKGVTPDQFRKFCHGFAEGIVYVHQRFGTLPKAIQISDEDRNNPRYNIDTQTIFLPRKWIADMILLGNVRQSKTEPLILPCDRAAAMYAVEEAFHHYEVTRHGASYNLDRLGTPDGTANYDRANPLERDAKAVVRDALKAFGLLNAPIATEKVEPEDAAWLEAAKREANHQPPLPENLLEPLLHATPLLEKIALTLPKETAQEVNRLLQDGGQMYANGTWKTEKGETLVIDGTHEPLTRWRVQRVLGEAYQSASNPDLKSQLGAFMRSANLAIPAVPPEQRTASLAATPALAFAR